MHRVEIVIKCINAYRLLLVSMYVGLDVLTFQIAKLILIFSIILGEMLVHFYVHYQVKK